MILVQKSIQRAHAVLQRMEIMTLLLSIPSQSQTELDITTRSVLAAGFFF